MIFDGCEDISSDSDDSHIRHDNEISRQQEFRGFQIRILIQFGFQRAFEQFISRRWASAYKGIFSEFTDNDDEHGFSSACYVHLLYVYQQSHNILTS